MSELENICTIILLVICDNLISNVLKRHTYKKCKIAGLLVNLLCCSYFRNMAARPQLRGFLASNLKRDFTLAITVALTGLLSYKFLVQEPRKRRYEEYYKYGLFIALSLILFGLFLYTRLL